MAIASLMVGVLFWVDRIGFDRGARGFATIGHVVRALGTVKQMTEGRNIRLESGNRISAPIQVGDQVQTGEESAARILFFGGSTLELQPGTVIRFDEKKDDVSIRLLLGSAILEFPSESGSGSRYVFEKSDGKLAQAPEGKRFSLSLNAMQRLEEAVEVNILDAEQSASAEPYRLIVPTVKDRGIAPAPRLAAKRSRIGAVAVREPDNEQFVDIEKNETASFHWSGARAPASDPVIGYEVVVRPAFQYDVEDTARKRQAFRKKGERLEMAYVDGNGVFLWSVHAVTRSGEHGPSSEPRWVELHFPKRLFAPHLIKPKVE